MRGFQPFVQLMTIRPVGLNIVGPFPKAVGNKRYLLVGTDYLTKWVEAEPLANIKVIDAKQFVWKNIVTRFGVPRTLILNNGLQFDNKAFRRYCGELGIANKYSTPAYPQGNGQAEAVNKVIVNGFKKRLDDAKGVIQREMGRRAATCLMDLLDHIAMVNRRDAFRHDL